MLQEFAIAAFFGYFFGVSISNPLLLLFSGIYIAWIAAIGTNHVINSIYLTGLGSKKIPVDEFDGVAVLLTNNIPGQLFIVFVSAILGWVWHRPHAKKRAQIKIDS